MLSNFWKIDVALIFGLPLWLIAFREVFLWPSIFLQHANVSLPKGLENALGKLIITPVIHRHHHSIVRAEHDSNYGDSLVLWDKIFGSFQKPLASKPGVYGVQNCASDKYQTIDGMLLTPFYMDER